jgi:hypothetical protein
MKAHKYWFATLALLALPALLWSQETPEAPAQSTQVELMARAAHAKAMAAKARDLDIFALQYHKARELAGTLSTLVQPDQVTITSDDHSNRLIVAALPDRLEQIQRVIKELDTPAYDGPEAQQVMYRVYMVELPSQVEAMKSFSLMVDSHSGLSVSDIMDFVEKADIQLTNLDIVSDVASGSGERKQRNEIEGRAASPEAIQRLVEQIPGGRMQRLNWENEMTAIPAAQSAQLPPQIAEQIHKLLGAEAQTVGYWFGNLSAPGKIEAPIGPWTFELNVDTTPRADEVELEVQVGVVRQSPDKSESTWQILSNNIRGNLYRPVIIGYNRDNYGTRTMGALVIVPSEQ